MQEKEESKLKVHSLASIRKEQEICNNLDFSNQFFALQNLQSQKYVFKIKYKRYENVALCSVFGIMNIFDLLETESFVKKRRLTMRRMSFFFPNVNQFAYEIRDGYHAGHSGTCFPSCQCGLYHLWKTK